MVLSTVRCGTSLRLLRVDAGRGLRSRLTAMGLVPGAEIEVVANHAGGPLVVSVDGTRIVLGRGMAERIFVG